MGVSCMLECFVCFASAATVIVESIVAFYKNTTSLVWFRFAIEAKNKVVGSHLKWKILNSTSTRTHTHILWKCGLLASFLWKAINNAMRCDEMRCDVGRLFLVPYLQNVAKAMKKCAWAIADTEISLYRFEWLRPKSRVKKWQQRLQRETETVQKKQEQTIQREREKEREHERTRECVCVS